MSWVPVEASADPFPSRPDEVICPPESFGFEAELGEPAFEVRTGDCNYLTVSQPSALDVREGESVQVRIWHFELTSGETATAYVGLELGDQLIWDKAVPIPSQGELILEEWIADRDVEVATPVLFHVDNHGVNSWNLLEVSAGADRLSARD